MVKKVYMFIENANIALRFILELSALASLGYWGLKSGNGMIMKFILGVGSPLLIAILWGIFGAPGSLYQLPKPFQWLLILGVYFMADSALYASGEHYISTLLGLIAIVNSALMYIWRQ